MSATVSRRDFLKLSGLLIADAAVQQMSKNFRHDVVHETELFAMEECLRVSLQRNLVIPEDWPGDRVRLMNNRDFKSADSIFDDTMDAVRSANVTPIFMEPVDGIDLTEEILILSPVLFDVINVITADDGSSGAKSLADEVVTKIVNLSSNFRDFTENPINDITGNINHFAVLASQAYMKYSGISQRACMATGIVRSTKISDYDEFTMELNDGSMITNRDLFTDQFDENEIRIPTERGIIFRNTVLGDIEATLNTVYSKRGKSNLPQSISDLISTTIIRNNGDVVSGFVDAMLIVKLLARNDIDISIDDNNCIHLSGSLLFSPSDVNADFLATMFKDEFSLVAPTPELTSVSNEFPQYKMSGDPNTYDDKKKDFQRKNRSGGLYHGLSEMMMNAFFRPEINSAIIISYYNILGSIKEWTLSNKEVSFIDFFRESFDVRAHGLVKTFSDLAILLQNDHLHSKFHSL